jgi:hypothetical protein
MSSSIPINFIEIRASSAAICHDVSMHRAMSASSEVISSSFSLAERGSVGNQTSPFNFLPLTTVPPLIRKGPGDIKRERAHRDHLLPLLIMSLRFCA